MDHARIDENQIADRYLMRKLDEAERRSFEEHFVDCAECLERLEAVGGLREGLKDLPAGRSEAATSVRPFVARARPLQIFLAAACLVVAAAASLFFYAETRRTRRELEAVRQASQRSRQREAELEGALARERTLRPPPPDTALRALAAAPLAATVFTLNVTRGASPEPGNRIVLPDAPGWLVLLFDRPDRPAASHFRVRLATSDGHSVSDPVAAGAASGGMLAVSIPSTLLAAGDYRLALEDAGSGKVLVTYRFRAAPLGH